MALTNLTRAANQIKGYMGRVHLWNGSAWVDGGAVRNPQIEITSVNREADSEGRQPALAYDFNINFALLDVDPTIKAAIDANRTGGKIYFGKTSASDPSTAPNADGFLIEGAWLVVNASLNFSGEGDAYECSINFRALPADAAGLFDGTSNQIVLP